MISANQKLQYPIALLLSIASKKTVASLARTIDVSEHIIWKSFRENKCIIQELKAVADRVLDKRRWWYAIVDDTTIAKIYSRSIEGTSSNYESSSKSHQWGLCSVVMMITDGKRAIPIMLRNWQQEEIAREQYKSKIQLAQELIEEIRHDIAIAGVIMDGLYAHVEMMQWLIDRTISFEMRMHANRVVTALNGETAQLKNLKLLQLKGSRRCKTIPITWHNLTLYVTVVKRFNKHGECSLVYQVSNYHASADYHRKVYGYRWNIEKFFRTAKQYLGFTHCQSRKLDVHVNHQLNVFLAYAILQWEQRKRQLDSPEQALRRLKAHNYQSLESLLLSSYQIFGGYYA